MTTHDALLAAVLANPADDLPRLVLADHLDERNEPGDAERAEFIRFGTSHTFRNQLTGSRAWVYTAGPPIPSARLSMLYEAIADMGGDSWAAGVEVVFRGPFVSAVHCTPADWCGGNCDWSGYSGDHSECNHCDGSGTYKGIGLAVVRSHPLDRVELVGVVRPLPDGWAQITRRDAGILYDVIFPGGSESDTVQFHIGQEPRFLEMASAAAIAWAKYQPTHAVYHGDGQTYCIVPTRA